MVHGSLRKGKVSDSLKEQQEASVAGAKGEHGRSQQRGDGPGHEPGAYPDVFLSPATVSPPPAARMNGLRTRVEVVMTPLSITSIYLIEQVCT